MKVLRSNLDRSVNFAIPRGEGYFEARFVRREADYFIVYLSSQSGCDKACRMCHLTATGQTFQDQASQADFERQAELVLDTYKRDAEPARRVNFNWMARGEPLQNPALLGAWKSLSQNLADKARSCDLAPTFNISTIFPAGFDRDLAETFAGPHRPVLFYSLYSLDPVWRKRWLPKAENPEIVLPRLAEWQARTDGEVVLHWAFISGENDDEDGARAIAAAVRRHGLRMRFNLVRYNPHGSRHGVEPDEAVLVRNLEILGESAALPGTRIVPRVGFDVKASCGMFVDKKAI
ncbi:MAG: radical SAM enzyme, Cfr family protein [Azospirillum sp.]|nr:radical SAM enzyme, Cfr family protein [Azospirillum sp.]